MGSEFEIEIRCVYGKLKEGHVHICVRGHMENRMFFRQVWWLLRKDLLLEWRSRDRLTMMFFFVVVSLGIFGLSLRVDPSIQREILAGVLWSILAFAGTLGMNQLYAAEREDEGLEGLRMAPVPKEALFLAKQGAVMLFLFLCAMWAVPLASVMFGVSLSSFVLSAVPIFLLGMWGFSIIGTLMATLLLNARFRDALLPLLFLPVALPVVIAGAQATNELIGQAGIPHTSFWIRGLAFFDIFFLVVGLWLFRFQFEQ